MTRATAAVRIGVVGALFWASGVAAGPAQAGLGDPVGTVVDNVDAVDDTVDRVSETVDDVVRDTGRTLTQTVRQPVDRVVEVVEVVEREVPEATDHAGQQVADVQRDVAPAPRPAPRRESGSEPRRVIKQSSTTAASPRRTTQPASTPRQQTSPARRPARLSSRDDAPRRVIVGGVVGRAAPAVPADHPCASASLAVRDLRRCGRAGVPAPAEGGGDGSSLPSLGGVARTLLPAGLAMLGAGLVLVAAGRRRRAAVMAAG